MSSKPETTFINSVHKLLPPELHREKMYNPFRGGTADCWYSGRANDLWIEYKYLDSLPVRAGVDLVHGKNPTLTLLQQAWLLGRWDEGRNVWVVVGCAKGGVVMDGPSWNTPWLAKDFRDAIVDRRALARKITNFTMKPRFKP